MATEDRAGFKSMAYRNDSEIKRVSWNLFFLGSAKRANAFQVLWDYTHEKGREKKALIIAGGFGTRFSEENKLFLSRWLRFEVNQSFGISWKLTHIMA